jgi:hypothetical protein
MNFEGSKFHFLLKLLNHSHNRRSF